MSQVNELGKELERQLEEAEKTFKNYANQVKDNNLKADMLKTFEEIKKGNISMNELNNKAKLWQSNSDK